MSTTTSTYLAVSQNLARYQAMTAEQPDVTTATAYYKANIGSVKSAADLVGNYRLLSYALQAYGLGNEINSTALVKKVLEGGVSNPKSLANTLPNPAWKAFAAAFDFTDPGSASPSSASSVATTTGDYVEEQLEEQRGSTGPRRAARAVFSTRRPDGHQFLWNFGQREFAGSRADDLRARLDHHVLPDRRRGAHRRQTRADVRTSGPHRRSSNSSSVSRPPTMSTYGPTSGSSSSLTVVDGSQPTTVSAASSVLADVVSSNASALSGLQSTTLFSPALLESLQGVTLGG